jgi:hypothetical protein
LGLVCRYLKRQFRQFNIAGFVYIMSNPSMRGLLKIGSSSKDPTKHRAKELNTTGVPDPFKCEYYAFVDNFVNFEKAVHRDLSAQRYRANREFFRITVGPAIESFRLVSARMNGKYT